ncbi:MAG: patatin-like phospholipase family protein [bacterium]|nr:patatin-like phospholipase family protein [bacterium]
MAWRGLSVACACSFVGWLLTSCAWPARVFELEVDSGLDPLPGLPVVRAIDGRPNQAFQVSFDQAIAEFARTPVPADGTRDFDMLVLSSGGVNGAFGAGVLTAWTERGDRPDFWTVTGVSVGALMAPFAFAGPEFDDRLEELFARISPADMHQEKGVISSVLFDESLMDNSPLRRSIARGVDMELMRAVAKRHREGRRCMVGSTYLDYGHFVVWDLGAIATVGTDKALELFRNVLTASAAIPVVYPPVRFATGEREELHVDGAVIRPLFMPQNIFNGYKSAERAGIDWDDVEATMYVIHNGSLRPKPVAVQRDTLDIATRTVTMMSYTMINEHVLHLFMLSQAWKAQFRFATMDYGDELNVQDFTPDDTLELFEKGRELMTRSTPWQDSPPGYLLRQDIERLAPVGSERNSNDEPGIVERLRSIEVQLRELRSELRAARGK